MKTRIFVLFISILAWVGCDRREIPTYNTGNHYIEFERAKRTQLFLRLFIIRIMITTNCLSQ